MSGVTPSGWKRYRHKADPGVVYTARRTKTGDYQLRGPGLGSATNLRVPKAFFERHYEPEEGTDAAERRTEA